MLGLLLLYYIAKHYAKLAEVNGKSKWAYRILGIVTYYAVAIFAGLCLSLYLDSQGTPFDDQNDFVIGLFGLPFGILACYGLHEYLRKRFTKTDDFFNDTILDNDIFIEN